jgi:hypothetical protein
VYYHKTYGLKSSAMLQGKLCWSDIQMNIRTGGLQASSSGHRPAAAQRSTVGQARKNGSVISLYMETNHEQINQEI